MKENTGRIVARLPVSVATFLLNEKRPTIHDIERRQATTVVLIPVLDVDLPFHPKEPRLERDGLGGVDRSAKRLGSVGDCGAHYAVLGVVDF